MLLPSDVHSSSPSSTLVAVFGAVHCPTLSHTPSCVTMLSQGLQPCHYARRIILKLRDPSLHSVTPSHYLLLAPQSVDRPHPVRHVSSSAASLPHIACPVVALALASFRQPPPIPQPHRRHHLHPCPRTLIPLRPTSPPTNSPSKPRPPSGPRQQRPSAGMTRPDPHCATTASSSTTTRGSPTAHSTPPTTVSTCTVNTAGASRRPSYTTRLSLERSSESVMVSCSSKSASWRVRCVQPVLEWVMSSWSAYTSHICRGCLQPPTSIPISQHTDCDFPLSSDRSTCL